MESTSIANENSGFFTVWLTDIRSAAEHLNAANLCPYFPAEVFLWVLGKLKNEKNLMEAAGVEAYQCGGIPGNLYHAREVYDGLFAKVAHGPKKAKNKASFRRGTRSPSG